MSGESLFILARPRDRLQRPPRRSPRRTPFHAGSERSWLPGRVAGRCSARDRLPSSTVARAPSTISEATPARPSSWRIRPSPAPRSASDRARSSAKRASSRSPVRTSVSIAFAHSVVREAGCLEATTHLGRASFAVTKEAVRDIQRALAHARNVSPRHVSPRRRRPPLRPRPRRQWLPRQEPVPGGAVPR